MAETIDDGPEVYETSDVEEPIQITPEEPTDPAIDTQDISLDNKELYENDVIDSGKTDFGDSVSSSRAGFKSKRVAETKQQRLTRIRNELSELALEEESADADIHELREILEQLCESHREQKSHPKYEAQVLAVPSTKISPSAPSTNAEQTIELDSRLKKLEDALGVTDPLSNSVQGSLNDIYRRLNLLQNSDDVLPRLKAELRSLNSQMGTLAHRTRLDRDVGMEDDSTARRIDVIYDAIQAHGDLGSTVDAVLARLRSLNRLQLDVGSTTHLLGELTDKICLMEQETKQWQETLENLERKTADYTQVSNSNFARVDELVSSLESKLDAIGM